MTDRLALIKEADAILKRARCDIITAKRRRRSRTKKTPRRCHPTRG